MERGPERKRMANFDQALGLILDECWINGKVLPNLPEGTQE
jgi:hypothetical protein